MKKMKEFYFTVEGLQRIEKKSGKTIGVSHSLPRNAGEFDFGIDKTAHQIYFKAKKSYTITRDEWVAFHIELPWSIRKSKEKYSLFGEVLAETIRELLLSYDELSKLHLSPRPRT